MTALQITWFFLIGVLLIGYAILDGFDLGVGFWHLFTKNDHERRVMLNSIGPVWDGNEVWLLTGGGAIFAAFPPVYASVFSGFYLAMMLVLFALISRAVSLEFRSKVESPAWRRVWDVTFSISSIVAALLFGVALGNILRGVPLDEQGNYTGTFFGLLNPYALVIGLTGLFMIATHGALYTALKAEKDLEDRAQKWARTTWFAYIVLFLIAAFLTFQFYGHLTANYIENPILFAFPALTLASMIAIFVFLGKQNVGKAFIASSVAIAGNLAIAGFALYPNMVPAFGNPERSLTAFNSSSSQNTLTVMLILALVGMPLVLGYTIFIYRKFKGKVTLDEHSY